MLDEQTPAEAGTTDAGSTPEQGAAPAPDTSTDTPATEPPAKPARKRAPRKTAAKKAAAAPPADTAADSPVDAPAADPPGAAAPDAASAEAPPAEKPAPARKRAPRKTAAKKAAPPPPAADEAPSDAPAPAAEAEAAAAEAPAPAKRATRARKTATKRTSKKAVAKAPVGDVDTAADAAPAIDAAAAEAGAATSADASTTAADASAATAAAAAAATSAVEQPPAQADQPLAEDEAEVTEETDEAQGAVPAPEGAQPEQAASDAEAAEAGRAVPAVTPLFQPPDPAAARPTRKRATKKAGPPKPAAAAEEAPKADEPAAAEAAEETPTAPVEGEPQVAAEQGPDRPTPAEEDAEDETDETEGGGRRRRRRGGRRRRKPSGEGGETVESTEQEPEAAPAESKTGPSEESQSEPEGEGGGTSRRRRRRRRSGESDDDSADDAEGTTVTKVRKPRTAEDEITGFTGSTRLEAKKQRRREGREAGRRRAPIISEAEFLARRESVDRKMVIRQRGDLTQIAVLEDKVLVEHYVARESQTSLIGNVYLGRVQNVLPSMEAAFIDIGKGRNAVLYAGEVNWDALGAKDGKQRKIEQVLKSGQSVLVQVTKDPIGHKGARLTSQISLPGRFLVYVPDGTTSGISRKLPDNERNRLKSLLKEIVPDSAGVIVRTAAEGASETELTRDVERLKALWEDIESKVERGNAPQLLYGEPDLTLKVVRDLFTEDIGKLVISGDEAWEMVQQYVDHVAPDLADRLERHDDSERDAFAEYRIDEQIAKALDRKVWLPSGGSLVIDRTEAMTVVDVNTGKFTGSGGNLEETVTKNNLEAAEEIVRQLRLRDIGGIIVVDFIDMVLESNRDLVLRRLIECLGRDRTRHQVAEVTSLGLVQMTRKRIGTGLLEAFSESCEACGGRGLIIHQEPVEQRKRPAQSDDDSRRGRRGRGRKGEDGADEGRNGQDGKESGRGRSGRDGRSGKDKDAKDAGDGQPTVGKRPTPAEFAAMVRSEHAAAARSEGEVEAGSTVGSDTAPEAVSAVAVSEPVTDPVAEPAEPVAPTDEPVTQAVTATEIVVPDESPAESRPAPAAEPSPQEAAPQATDGQPEPAPVPTGPRIVTRVRRVGARRAAGPPAAVASTSNALQSTAVDPPAVAGAPSAPVAEGTGDTAPEHEEAVHVPVKKKGSRKR